MSGWHTNSVDRNSGRLTLLVSAVHQELQDPVQSEGRHCGTLLSALGTLWLPSLMQEAACGLENVLVVGLHGNSDLLVCPCGLSPRDVLERLTAIGGGGVSCSPDGLFAQQEREPIRGRPAVRGKRTDRGRPGQRVEEQGTWASRTQKHSEAGYGRPVDRGAWTAKTVKRPRQQPAHPQYANYWAPLRRKRHTMPHSAQFQHANYWAPRTRKRHQQEHRPQRPTESSDLAQHAKGRTGDCPGPRKGATTRRNVTQGEPPPPLWTPISWGEKMTFTKRKYLILAIFGTQNFWVRGPPPHPPTHTQRVLAVTAAIAAADPHAAPVGIFLIATALLTQNIIFVLFIALPLFIELQRQDAW